MDLNQLRAFIAVAKHESFTRAADELHLSQPTVSGQIKALEVELGVSLFERGTSRVGLSRAGERLLPKAQKILCDVSEFMGHAKALRGHVSGKIRVGTLLNSKLLRLGELLSEVKKSYPDLEVETFHGLSGWIMGGIRRGDLDFGFFLGDNHEQDVCIIPLTKLTYRIVAPASWDDLLQSARWDDIAAMPWVWPVETSALEQIGLSVFRSHGLNGPLKITKADRESTLIDLVSSGVGLAFVRESVATALAEAGTAVIWDHGSTEATLSVVYLTARQNDPVILAISSVLKRIWP